VLFQKPVIGPLKSKVAEIRHLENRHDVIFFCHGRSDLVKFHRLVQNDIIWSKSKLEVEFQYGRRSFFKPEIVRSQLRIEL